MGAMNWVITVYLIFSAIVAISAAINAGLLVGVYTFAASSLGVTAGGGLKFGLLWGDKQQRIGVPVVAILLIALVLWLGSGFSVTMFGRIIGGEIWGIIGVVIGLVCVSKRMAT